MQKYALLISYLGADFCGWQKQPQLKPSIQKTLEEALYHLTGQHVSCIASGRTDAGVHAWGQVVHFVLEYFSGDTRRIFYGLNYWLPQTIRILAIAQVDLDFHARKHAIKKQYSYYLQQGPCALPAAASVSWWIRQGLCLRSMSMALQSLLGWHDFRVFQASGGMAQTTHRHMFEAQVLPVRWPGCSDLIENNSPFFFIRIRLVGSGFLKQMVRSIVGTLVEVGQYRRQTDDFKKILISQDRRRIGITAPGCGLWLDYVSYAEPICWQWGGPVN